MKTKPILLSLTSLLALASTSHAASFIVNYNFEDTNSPNRQTPIVSGAGAANVTADDASLGAGLPTTGTTASGFSGATDSIFVRSSATAATEAGAVTGNDYFQFTVTANAGFTFSLSSISYDIFAEDRALDSAGITINTFLRSNAEATDYTTTLTGSAISDFGDANPTSSSDMPPVNYANGASALVNLGSNTDFQGIATTTFRLYQFDDATDDNKFGRIDNIVISGDVSAIPEPSTALLSILSLAGLLAVRRR